ncbi:MAG: hypothetical protein E7I83_09620 [Veillonella sp.]|nr:hypothetical protein [Veillonella sp.]
MYLHIGDNFSIPMNSILTMIHAESTYIVTDDGVYASGISLKTLKKRIDEFYMLLSSKL